MSAAARRVVDLARVGLVIAAEQRPPDEQEELEKQLQSSA